MSLSKRVRDGRYAKGWGPDELAQRAEISRTALYQIESGRTAIPRASTLGRIAAALGMPVESLIQVLDPAAEEAAPGPMIVPRAEVDSHRRSRRPQGSAEVQRKVQALMESSLAAESTTILDVWYNRILAHDARHSL